MLKKYDRIVFSGSAGAKSKEEAQRPKTVTIVEEYPCFYVCERRTEFGSYKICINKADLICGDTKVKRKKV